MPHQRSPLSAVLCVAFYLTLPSDSMAAIVTLDFDSATPGTLLQNDYFEDGFRMSVLAGHYDIDDPVDGENHMHTDTFAGGLSTLRFDLFGASFDLLSFDTLYWIARSDGLPIDELAYVTSSDGGYEAIMDAGRISLSGTQWRDITWVAFTVFDPNRGSQDLQQDNLGFDNLRLRVSEPSTSQRVPEPSTLLLALFGFAATAMLRR